MNWISVEDKLPEDESKTYLVYGANNYVQIMWFNIGNKEWWNSHTLIVLKVSDSVITHWQPIIAPNGKVI